MRAQFGKRVRTSSLYPHVYFDRHRSPNAASELWRLTCGTRFTYLSL